MVSDANAIPNPDLEPETTKSWEFGLNVKRDSTLTENDKARLKLAYFHNDHENYISRVPSNAGPGEYLFTFENIDKAMFSGIEMSGSYDTGTFFANAALTYYTDYEFCWHSTCGEATVDTDYAVTHIPPDVSVSLTLGTRLFDERLVVGGARYTCRRKTCSPYDFRSPAYAFLASLYDGRRICQLQDRRQFHA